MKPLTPGQPDSPERRAFLQRSGQLALAGTAAPLALNLAAVGQAAAQTATDYKALVCVFLFGGNDHANTVVAFDDANHALYTTLRGTALATPKSQLAATELVPSRGLANGAKYALAPEMPELAALFNGGQAAVMLNVGPLVVPLTKQQYLANVLAQPPKLFSHNDQQSVWQAQGAEGTTRGWGGRIADVSMAANGNPLYTCVQVANDDGFAGDAVFLSGHTAQQYQCTTAGAVPFEPTLATNNFFYNNTAVNAMFSEFLVKPQTHVLAEEYARVVRRSIAAEMDVRAALAAGVVPTAFPQGNGLASQLRVVAQMIAGRSVLGARRQVFMVSLGGFDTHDNQRNRHPGLLRKVSQALAAFYQATVDIGMAQQVTTFTASDFGRTLTSNGDGTDHGWGGHHFVVGGAVRGKAFYGTPPPMSVGNGSGPEDQWHVGQGRLLPSTSVDQYAATLARWFGLSDADLVRTLPQLANFGDLGGRPDYPINLGFMA
jgi:uncharacterized protein (DUF1501 family)